MQLLTRDAYEMIARFIDPHERLTVLDVGANRGDVAQHITEVFPNATVHSFEPASAPFEVLERVAKANPRIHAHRLAVGDASGDITLHICGNHLFTSALPAGDRGRAYYGKWVDTARDERVRCVTLDEWSDGNDVRCVDILKIDVQGMELSVLRGAARLLREAGVRAIYSEAQLVQEYEGAATLTDIDLFLRETGFDLHQVHQIHMKGSEEQAAVCDVLWVERETLARYRLEADRWTQRRWLRRMREALSGLAERGVERVALYGAGNHTRAMAPLFEDPPLRPVAIIDDDPTRHGGELFGMPIVSRDTALAMTLDAVVISSNSYEDNVFDSCEPFYDSGVEVLRLYAWPAADRHVAPRPVA